MSDQAARQLAVEPGRSVIVQAPAGSGKTSLLVERYLALLSTVEEPEAILAITFTRKAAAEMRERVLQFLDPGFVATKPHEAAAKARAEAVEDRVEAWGLRQNPQRLMIRTIDSFNQYLARAMPVASQLGPVPTPAEHTQALYREAARRVLARLNTEDDGHDNLSEDLARLLQWRDHRSQDIESLLMSLLGQREQWLRAIGRIEPVEREAFEATLHSLVRDHLEQTRAALQRALTRAGSSEAALLGTLGEAASCAMDLSKPTPYADWEDYSRLPGTDPAELDGWKMLGFALLTNAGTWRASLNKNYGFPPKTDHKAAMEGLLETWAKDDELAALIHQARELPIPEFGPGEWPVLAALIRVLKQAAAELDLLFAERGRSDFAALGNAAQRGLGNEEDGYSDLALYLDQRIDHILVDEYQDTNWGQFHLLEKLVAGWAGEGEQQSHRSLFLVGDPMQSIYRFREAEVGLFLRTREQGIGAQQLESAQLTRNFRSRSEIVEWVNERIGPAFPEVENMAAGAVRYAPSEPARDGGGRVEVLSEIDRVQEAEALATRIRDTLAANAGKEDFKAAVIVRARSHLSELLPALARHGLRYRAVKLDPLLQRPVAQDLLSITRLVVDPAHPSARLALLRSPLCGLSLHELHALAGDGRDPLDEDALDRLPPEARGRAEAIYSSIEAASALRGRLSVRDRVEGLFLRLGGPQILAATPTDQRDAQRFLNVLAQAEDDGLLEDWNGFMALLDEQQTEGDPPDEDVRLEVLTMHGAKGLEWDAVFLPGLDRPPRGASPELLYWLPITPSQGEEQVLLAPLRSAEQADNTALIRFIQNQRKQREAYEQQRLLYVAATRAREYLCLSAVLDPTKDAPKPGAGSLLASLWPTCEADFLRSLNEAAEKIPLLDPEADSVIDPPPQRRRVQAGWRPTVAPTLDWKPALPPREHPVEIEFNWQNRQARRIGTVLHRVLEEIGRVGLEAMPEDRLTRLRRRIPGLLQAMGTGQGELVDSVEVVRTALDRTLASKDGRWILSGKHPEHDCELALSGVIDGELVNAVIDRTFVDTDGVRWIIDYKSGFAEDEDIEAFLEREAEHYREQLETYRRLFEQQGETEIKTALYLPRLDRLQEL